MRIWQYHISVESSVGAVVVPVFQVFFDGKPELPLIGKDDLVQALCLYCPDKVFHPGVHHRSKQRQFLYFYSDWLKNHIKAFIEHWGSVMNQIAFAQQEAVPHIAHISCDLRCPVAVRIMRNTSAADFSGTDIHKEQEMPPFKFVLGSHLHVGEVCCCWM